MKKFLHVGCGKNNKSNIKRGFNNNNWKESRLDIDKEVNPDFIGTMTNMSSIKDNSYDALFSSHNIEHLYPHEVPQAVKEFHRVLKPNGFAVITCPDLVSVCKFVVEDKLMNPIYDSASGPISPIDILYGHRGFIANGNEYMAHKCGFTYSVLSQTFMNGGFKECIGGARPQNFDLWIIVFKDKVTKEDAQNHAHNFLP